MTRILLNVQKPARIAERAVRRIKEGTATVMVQRGLPDQWWDYPVECCCCLHNVHDQMGDGKEHNEKKLRCEIRWAATSPYLPKRTLPGIFIGYISSAGRDGKATCSSKIAENPSASDIHVKRLKHQEVAREKPVAPTCKRISQTHRSFQPPRGEEEEKEE